MERTGFVGDCFYWFPTRCLMLLGMVGGFIFGRGDVVEVAVEALRVEPVHSAQCSQLDVFDRLPRPLVGSVDQLGLAETVGRFGQGVIERIADRSDRRDGTDLGVAFPVSDAGVLLGFNWSLQHRLVGVIVGVR